ncbi:MAG: hypothetical protein HN509_08595 [Halobacteriovoraceae bacterium]|jgi:iron-sulfur cluster insertion protein|nr:hypothetical protein [Halobacteriovoraceae bacterium]MBT5095078.1 hypothetical protein [Halobacteriovoraceae bacterium]
MPASEKSKIDREKVSTPQIILTAEAKKVLSNILEQDFTLAGKYFRVLISGKGCEGFKYSTGFTDFTEEDFTVLISSPNAPDMAILMDPFTAFYIPHAEIDFVRNYSQDEEGFVVTNLSQAEFKGKFWRQSPEKIPPLMEK